MTTYLRDAKFHANQIEHYYKHAGDAGYAQAHHHLLELEELVMRAHRSNRGRNDVPIIQTPVSVTLSSRFVVFGS